MKSIDLMNKTYALNRSRSTTAPGCRRSQQCVHQSTGGSSPDAAAAADTTPTAAAAAAAAETPAVFCTRSPESAKITYAASEYSASRAFQPVTAAGGARWGPILGVPHELLRLDVGLRKE